MTSNAEKQRRHREKRSKELGLVEVKVYITESEKVALSEHFKDSYDGGNSLKDFYRKSLVRGGVFVANAGKGRRYKKSKEGYKK